MKKKFILIISIACVLLLIAGIYVYDTSRRFNQINFTYYGVDGGAFYYQIDAEGLNCELKPDINLKNGDIVSLSCHDNLIGFLHHDRDFPIDGLFSVCFDTADFQKLISPLTFNGQAYAKTDDKGIHLLILFEDNGTYSSVIYDNLYYQDDTLYQVDDISDQASYSTSIAPSSTLANIDQDDLDAYIKLYFDKGYIKIA